MSKKKAQDQAFRVFVMETITVGIREEEILFSEQARDFL